MKNLNRFLAGLCIIALTGAVVASQRAAPRVGEVDEYVGSVQSPVMEAMVEEGWLLDWGYLAHHYGDEWNRVVYYVSATLARHVEFSTEVTRRQAAARPG